MLPVSFTFQNKAYNNSYSDLPAFRGKYELFWKNYNKELRNIPLRDTILKSINNESNFLGEGHTKKGYILEGLKNYVIRIFKKNFNYKDLESKFSKPERNYLNILEDVIASIPGKIDIVKRKYGKPLGVPKYSERLEVNHFPSLSSIQVTREETLNLLNIYDQLKSFPLRSYIQAHRQLKKFCKQPGFQFDIISPNNILVDTKSKKINIIDPVTPEINEPVHGKNTDFSKYHGCDSLYPVLCDFIMQKEHLANLTPEEAIKWKKAMNTIISKCIRAGEYVGLERNIDKIRILYYRITKFWKSDELCQRFDNFIDMYSGSTKEEQTREDALNYNNNVRTRIKAIRKLDASNFNDVKPIFEKIIKANHQPKVEFPEILNAALEKIMEYDKGTKSILPVLEELFDKEIFYPTKKRLYRLFILTKSKNKRFWEEISKSAANPVEKVLYKQEIEELLKTSNFSKKKIKNLYNNYMHGERVTQELVDKLWISRSCLRADETQKYL